LLLGAGIRIGLPFGTTFAEFQVTLETAEVGFQLGGGLAAQIAVLLKCLVEDAHKIGGQHGIQLGSRPGIAVKDGVEDHG